MALFYSLYFLSTSERTRVKFSKSWLDFFLIDHSSPLTQYHHSANRSVVYHLHAFFRLFGVFYVLLLIITIREVENQLSWISPHLRVHFPRKAVFTYSYCLVPRNLHFCSVLVLFCLCCEFNVESAYHFHIREQSFALQIQRNSVPKVFDPGACIPRTSALSFSARTLAFDADRMF
jgi:hypothetical protein